MRVLGRSARGWGVGVRREGAGRLRAKWPPGRRSRAACRASGRMVIAGVAHQCKFFAACQAVTRLPWRLRSRSDRAAREVAWEAYWHYLGQPQP